MHFERHFHFKNQEIELEIIHCVQYFVCLELNVSVISVFKIDSLMQYSFQIFEYPLFINNYSKCSKILNTGCLPKRSRQTRQT